MGEMLFSPIFLSDVLHLVLDVATEARLRASQADGAAVLIGSHSVGQQEGQQLIILLGLVLHRFILITPDIAAVVGHHVMTQEFHDVSLGHVADVGILVGVAEIDDGELHVGHGERVMVRVLDDERHERVRDGEAKLNLVGVVDLGHVGGQPGQDEHLVKLRLLDDDAVAVVAIRLSVVNHLAVNQVELGIVPKRDPAAANIAQIKDLLVLAQVGQEGGTDMGVVIGTGAASHELLGTRENRLSGSKFHLYLFLPYIPGGKEG